MRLSNIKLAGFKSFCEPTQLSFPINRIGLVGPNGCGKSNIIDAVRWVLGESSAAGLRGSSLGDIIFNGSEERAAVGRASVEMMFEGDLSQLSPQYAQQRRIKIRRSLAREQDSRYYINNTLCRRKDIASLFAGMGLTGKAKFAIVTQGSVHNIAESKPEHVRMLIEEAADITDYLQKRKETLSRIKTTRLNLQQVNLTRKESERRMRALQTQAEDAKRVLALRKEWRSMREELTIGEYVQLRQQHQGKEEEQAAMLRRLNEHKNASAHLLAEEKQLEIKAAAADELLNQLQQDLSAVTRAIGGSESKHDLMASQLRERQADVARHSDEAKHLSEQLRRAANELRQVQAKQRTMQKKVASAKAPQPKRHEQQQDLDRHQQNLEEQQARLNRRWEEDAVASGQNQAEHARLTQEASRLQTQLERILATAPAEPPQTTAPDLATLTKRRLGLEKRLATHTAQLSTLEQQSAAAQHDYEEAQRHNQQDERERTRIAAAIQELMHFEQQMVTENAPSFLARLQPNDDLEVAPGWEKALDLVIHHLARAHKAEDLRAVVRDLEAHVDLPLVLVSARVPSEQTQLAGKNPLAALVTKGVAPVFLRHIYPCADLQEAMALRPQITSYQSLITAQCDWIGTNWAILRGGTRALKTQGVLTRKRRLRDLQTEQARVQQQLRARSDELAKAEATRDTVMQERDVMRRTLAENNRTLRDLVEQIGRHQQEAARAQAAAQTAAAERHHKQQERARLEAELNTVRQRLEQTARRQNELDRQQEELGPQRQEINAALNRLHQERDAGMQREHQRQQDLAALSERISFLHKNLADGRARAQALRQLRTEAKERLRAAQKEARHTRREMGQLNAKNATVTKKVATARIQRMAVGTRMEKVRGQINRFEKEIAVIERDMREARRVGEQLSLQLTDLMERNEELSAPRRQKKRKTSLSVSELKTRVRYLQSQLDRIGEVNQLALKDYEAEKEYHENLKTQTEQINHALRDLQRAIKRIDKESRGRFDRTLHQINRHFGQLFAILSDGGRAQLLEEKNDDDNRPAGIRIMASPPGRRHSFISLLSGGEKTLVAIALIMAIFQLDAAPFCLMDEADAMLDDENVMRFNRMLDAMARTTQFITITHNKITMESSRRLIGITMSEPGVSRAVAVDLARAVQLSVSEEKAGA